MAAKKASGAASSGVEAKVLKKAKAAEVFPSDILTILNKDEGTKDPAAAARLLQSLFEAGKLGANHPVAMEALSLLFQNAGAPLDILSADLVIGLLARAEFHSRGLDALALLAYPRSPERFVEARVGLSATGRLVLDAVRARHGERIEADAVPALVAHFVAQSVHLPTPEGRIRYAGAEEVLAVVSGIAPDEVWTAAYAEHFSKVGSHSLRPDVLRRFDEATLVRILLATDRLSETGILGAFLDLTPRAAPLWAALDALGDDVHKNPFHPATYFVRSALVCLAALASKREGAAVPASFEAHVQRTVDGYPMNMAGLDRLAAFFLEAFRALGPARARAFIDVAHARDEVRKQASLAAANVTEAALAALASGDADQIAAARERARSMPPSISALLG